jgi:predicted PurR-regulated permease PerM
MVASSRVLGANDEILAGVVGLVAAVPVTAFLLVTWDAVRAIVEPDTPPELPGLVPAWLDRMAQFSWRLLVVFGFIALLLLILTTIPLVVLPIIFALILAATLEPLTEILIRRGQPRGRAAIAAVSATFLAIAGVMILAVIALVDQAPELGRTVTDGAESASESLDGNLDLATDAVATGARATVETIVNLGQTFGMVILVSVVSALLALYFLRDGGQVWSWVVSHLRVGVRDDVQAAGSRAFNVLGGYMLGTGLISLVGAGSQWVIMVLLGLPLATPVFVLAFFLGYIPYIGSFIATLIAFLIAVAVGSNTDIVIMFIWTIVFNLVQGNVVAPLVYGKTVHIHPAIVLVAIPAGSALAGIMGMFIIVPVLGVVAVSWRTVMEVMSSRTATEGETLAPLSEPPAQPEPADST